LRGKPEAVPRPKRDSILDPHKTQIQRWIQEDHLYNCETMLERLREQGYTGNGTILREYVRPFRPRNVGHQPVMRYETKPGEQMQFDWGEVHVRHVTAHDIPIMGQHWREMLKVMELTSR
jgi:transposase